MTRALAALAAVWRVVAPHVVTAVALALVTVAAFLVYVPIGLVICALSLAVLERKIELDRSR
jgi:hypothetical protein